MKLKAAPLVSYPEEVIIYQLLILEVLVAWFEDLCRLGIFMLLEGSF